MTKTKKLNLFLCSLLVLLAGLFFASCGPKSYDSVTLTSSTSSINLDVGQSAEVVFTINNMVDDMDNTLSFSYSNEGVVTQEIIAQNGNQITVRLTAVRPDTTTMTTVTEDGTKSCNIIISVNEYSSFIRPGQNNLYVSSRSSLQPEASDFVFENETTERDMDFYFYGVNNGFTLDLSSVSSMISGSDGSQIRDFSNHFVSVKLISIERETQTLSYLIFADSLGREFTISNARADLAHNGNIKYDFLPVEANEGQYVIPTQAVSVGFGDTFTFIANYQNPNGEEIFTQREFVVQKDIDQNAISSEYEYVLYNPNNNKISEQGYFDEGFSKDKITLVPDYTLDYQSDLKVDFKRVRFQITLKGASDLLQSSFSSSNALTVTKESKPTEEQTVFVFIISANTDIEQDLTFKVNFFYKDFENSDDPNVNYTLSQEISIKNKPKDIVISGADFSNSSVSSRSFTFYNHYIESETVGWQRFYFGVLPYDSNFENLTINLQEDDGLIIRYAGAEYTSGEIVVDNLNNFVEFKGRKGAELTTSGQIEVVLNFNLLYQDKLTSTFNYQILQGSTTIAYDEEYSAFAQNGFAISLNNDVQGVDFSTIIYTDAIFDDFSVQLSSGVDVVKFEKAEQIYQRIDGRYYLNFRLVPTATGRGVYSITLPNGFAISVQVRVVESLNSLSLQTKNQNANMRIESFDDKQALIYARNNSSALPDRNNFDLEIIANANENSTAMRQLAMTVMQEGQVITFANRENFYFEVNLNRTGVATITATITGYNVEDFVVDENYQLTYTITVVSYEYINEFSVNKLSDGQGSYITDQTPNGASARYIYIYNNNANAVARKQAQLQVDVTSFSPDNPAFLFRSPQNSAYLAETFSNKFIAWTAPGYELNYNGQKVDSMYLREGESSLYQIVHSLTGAVIATFDAEQLLLTLGAGADGVTSFSLQGSIDQYNTQKRSFSINVNVLNYDAVESLSALSPISSLEFSSLQTEHQINLRVLQNTAINKAVRVTISGASVVDKDKTYRLFGENETGVNVVEIDGGIVSITLTADADFVKEAMNKDFFGGSTFQATLTIAAEDWYDDSGLFIEENRSRLIIIPITYANGTEKNRFTIDSSEDLEAIKKDLSAHYQVTTTISAQGITLPLGELTGSIIGKNDYAIINEITAGSLSEDGFAGLFSSIAEGAYIKNLAFAGKIQAEATLENDQKVYIGLIAGKNNGELKNVSVRLEKSTVSITGAESEVSGQIEAAYIGGLVGANYGDIIQDFGAQEEEYRLYSYTLFSEDFLTVKYSYADVYAGGIAGYSEGVIKKIDGADTHIGYTNYLAYALIEASLQQPGDGSQSYVGAVAGKVLAKQNGQGVLGYDGVNPYTEISYLAGKGVVVGGQVSGLNYVGGVVGLLEIDGMEASGTQPLAGITTRTFVRALSGRTNAGLFTGQIINNSQITISPCLYAQAVDDGKTGEKASMLVVYLTDDNEETLSTSIKDYTKIAFGLQGDNGTTFAGATNHFITFVRREYKKVENDPLPIDDSNSSIYYGDVCLVQGETVVIANIQFEEDGTEAGLAIGENSNLDNQMQAAAGTSTLDAFFAYYFNAASAQSESDQSSLADIQLKLNQEYNTVSIGDNLYPITITGEITLKSLNTNVLEIDQNGTMTIKGTGWAQVSGSSILNVNDGVSFYVFVTNYFNNDLVSTVYPTASANSDPIDNFTITMYANQSAMLYIKPNYEYDNNDDSLKIDKTGLASLDSFYFNMAQNTDISAEVTISDESEVSENAFDVSISGQTIVITSRGASSDGVEKAYKINIKPIIKGKNQNIEFSAYVNKGREPSEPETGNTGVDGIIDYKLGAIGIGASRYDNVTISTTTQINETIIIRSTADLADNENDNGEGLYYYIIFDGQVIQSIYDGAPVANEQMQCLFTVQIGEAGSDDNEQENNVNVYRFPLNITVNKESDAYKNRFEQNIYGEYTLVALSKTNPGYYVTIDITFENLPLQNILIDNYNDQDNMTAEIGMESEYTYPGKNSLLIVNLLPEDSDFEYLTIENADQNYSSGSGVATFALAGRKNNLVNNENLFEASKITGSATSKGLLLTKDEILNLYDGDSYKQFNGQLYFIYNIGNSGIVENNISRFIVRVYDDGQVIQEQYIDLTLRLEEFVSVSIEGKQPEAGTDIIYVARGLRYRLIIDSFGFNPQDIEAPIITKGAQYGTIVEENGEYYLQVTSGELGSDNTMIISVSATRQDDKVSAEGFVNIMVMQYVIDNSLGDKNNEDGNKDIISGMADGVIAMPIGSSRTLSVDIYDYIEYDSTNQSVVSMVESFVQSLTSQGKWWYYTNIAPGQSMPDVGAGQAAYEYNLPVTGSGENYYFRYNNLAIVPLRINDAEANLYNVKYQGRFVRQDSVYQVEADQGDATTITTTVKFEVFVSSSEESPIPVFNYQDFLDMHQGGHYILLNDITLPSKEYVENVDDSLAAYTPQVANFASLDGNGHAIVLSGTYDMGSASELGVFSSLASGSLIKNLNVKILSSYDVGDANYGVVFATTTVEHRTGLLVGRNNGSITNCKVYSPTNTMFTVRCNVGDIESAYVGGLVGENSGFVTNCTSSLSIYGSFNIGGVVGYNIGKIAACSYREGILRSSDNQVDEGFHVAGLVNVNASNGQVITSLVTGGITAGKLYSQSTTSYLSGPNFSAGLVYENQGQISDCYSDINLQGSANMAGFVYVNTGNIQNCFSLSLLQNNTIAAAGFAMRNTPFEEEQESVGDNENQADNSGIGTFENCYYLTERKKDSDPQSVDINIDLNPIVFEGVEGITSSEFGKLEEGKFDSYAYTNSVSTSGIWFFTGEEQTNVNFISFVPTNETSQIDNENGIGVQVNTVYGVSDNTLPSQRLELVSANIDSLSIRNFVDADIDESTGDATYNYEDDISTDATRKAYRGSIYNPHVIYNASTMESLILENNSPSSNQNTANYRLVADIDYSSEANSQIYKTVFAGNFEGNGMEISSIVLQSNAQMQSAGLFAGLGVSASRGGVIKNLVVSPSSVTFAGTTSVGGLVGFVNNGQIYNVQVITTNDLTVQGSNFVGGVVGRAQGNYIFKNIYSNVNAVAYYNPDQDQSYVENFNTAIYSYAGAAFGHLGSGNAKNIEVENVASVRGDRAGLAIGGIGRNAVVSTVEVLPSANNCIKAYRYGGLIAGEISGKLNDAVVYSGVQDFAPFSIVGQLPVAVGGVVGMLNGGQIDNVLMNQSFTVAYASSGTSYTSIENVGGIAGVAGAGTVTYSIINQAVVDAAITARITLGGAVGQVRGPVSLDQVAVKAEPLSVQGQTPVGTLGGLVGSTLTPAPHVRITNSYCQAELSANISNALNTPGLNIGGLIGVETSNIELYNCYTSSKINVILNYLNTMDFFKSLTERYYNEDNGAYDAVGIYKQHYKSEGTNNKVYYYGAQGNSGADTVSNFVNFSSNFAPSEDAVSINNYGADSYNLYGPTNPDITIAALYNIQFINILPEHGGTEDDEGDYWMGSNTGSGNTELRILDFESDLYKMFGVEK